MSEILNVHIGEIKIARKGETLKAILGSCVGIGFMWRRKKICGLAHCLLPENPEKTFSISGRYVNQAIASLIVLMKIGPEDIGEIEVLFVGGGNMTNPGTADNSNLIGEKIFLMAERELKRKGLKIVFFEHGGSQGRKVIIDSSSCSYRVEVIPRLESQGTNI